MVPTGPLVKLVGWNQSATLFGFWGVVDASLSNTTRPRAVVSGFTITLTGRGSRLAAGSSIAETPNRRGPNPCTTYVPSGTSRMVNVPSMSAALLTITIARTTPFSTGISTNDAFSTG